MQASLSMHTSQMHIGCFGSTRPLRAAGKAPISTRRPALVVRAEKVLIANTKGGGHAFIGLHLANQLLDAGHTVTLLNDGDQGKLSSKAPFSQYGALAERGANVVWGSPTDPSSLPSQDFDVVYDNNGKDMEACQPMIDSFKGKVAHYVFVGSAGAYKDKDVEPMHFEGDERKGSAGHVAVEKYLAEQGLPFTVFQPLYIYGPHTSKDCEQWFMERVLRGRPVPIPAPGIQLTTLTHVADVASMLAKVPGNKAAVGQHFNVCSDRSITFDGVARAVGAAAGKRAEIVHYDPADVGLKKGEGFPFRTTHFFASAEKAKRELGWAPAHAFLDDLPALVEEFQASGRLDKDVDFSVDERIFEAVGHKVPVAA